MRISRVKIITIVDCSSKNVIKYILIILYLINSMSKSAWHVSKRLVIFVAIYDILRRELRYVIVVIPLDNTCILSHLCH